MSKQLYFEQKLGLKRKAKPLDELLLPFTWGAKMRALGLTKGKGTIQTKTLTMDEIRNEKIAINSV